MKLLIDPQIFWWQNSGGVSRYIAEIYDNMSRQDGIEVSMPLLAHDNAYLQDKGIPSESKLFDYLAKFRFKGSDRLRRKLAFAHANKLLNVLKLQEHDLLVPSYYCPYFLKQVGAMPYVLTVHDMTHELYPKMLPGTDQVLYEKKKAIDQATHLIAISQSTKQDLLRFYPASEGKISVIYHGFTANSGNVETDINLPNEYILFVGKRMKYKNLKFLLLASQGLLKSRTGLKLICAGSKPFDKEERASIEKLGLSGAVMHMAVNDHILAQLYQNAVCFVYPSLNEGFGFPVLEAMSCGCPTVLSRASSFPEVAGRAGLYYESMSELTAIMESLLKNEVDRASIIQTGLEQTKQFSWQKCIDETMALYLKVVSSAH